ncbi:Cytochrome c biogenesis protein CcsA [uncultured archaeon]|nr:Cytochrome c biogenesis protein CcsA [uncultured archaeon]
MDSSYYYHMFMRNLLILSWVLVAAGMYIGLVVTPPVDVLGDSYRIFFFHLPASILAFLSFTVTAAASIMYLRKRDIKWDDIAVSSVKLGFVFGALALLTGWVFSYAAWGTKWSWDPKVMATFVMWFVYIGYIILRNSTDEPQRRARQCAVYGLVGYATVPLAYLSSRLVYSLHPESIGLTPHMQITAFIMVAGFVLLYSYLLWFNAKLEKISRSMTS